MRDGHHLKQGSAMVESCLVIAMLCLILFGLLQVSYLVSARNIINYSSLVAVRSAAVGLDESMVRTVIHYATLPTAGPVVQPDMRSFKKARPKGDTMGAQWDYALSSDNASRSELGAYEVLMHRMFHRRDFPLTVLNYENWSPEGEAEVFSDYDDAAHDEDYLTLTVSQNLPLTFPFARAFFPLDPLIKVSRGGRTEEYPARQLKATSYMEDHAKLYLKAN